MYSVLAGFVEPGESLEECVARELEEEVGIEVGDIAYFASQPWPFPHSLMIGFTATWLSGDLRIEEAELVDARWFTRDDLPELPGSLSIARRLIDDWLCRQAFAISSATISPARMKACGSMSVIQARTAVSGTPSVLVTASWIAFRPRPFPRSCDRGACGSG